MAADIWKCRFRKGYPDGAYNDECKVYDREGEPCVRPRCSDRKDGAYLAQSVLLSELSA